MKLRIYLDTSVISACGDARSPERRVETLAFFGRRPEFEMTTSTLTEVEIRRTLDQGRRAEMLQILQTIPLIAITPEMEQLAQLYLRAGIFEPKQADDALHVATATVSRISVVVSWNFRHLVNRRRRSMVLAINAGLRYPTIEIVSPPEA